MLGGFNTNVPYKDDTYHVQTEDGGTKYPILTTHLYNKGAILASEKFNYAELLIEDNWKEKVLQAMKEQHRRVIKDLLAGKYTGDAEKTSSASSGAPGGFDSDSDKSLEDRVLEYIIPQGR